ncbi:MAG: DNA cytosine methyltransferase [Planctomycetota bacterium]
MRQPLAIDLYCGLGGWTEGLLLEGYRVIGFDNERHVYGEVQYPAQLVVQDVLTLDGAQFKDAALIVASPPCQAYSYRAMPWKRAKALPPPDNTLFEACFRIQREACEAAGHHIPLVVENVRGAQPYVGRSKYHFGSFHLWGDVPALMPMTRGREVLKEGVTHRSDGATKVLWKNRPIARYAHPTPEEMEKHGFTDIGKGARFTSCDCGLEGIKQGGIGGMRKNGKGDGWFQDGAAQHGSNGSARKRASAMIAKIPLVLSRHIARAWKPVCQ